MKRNNSRITHFRDCFKSLVIFNLDYDFKIGLVGFLQSSLQSLNIRNSVSINEKEGCSCLFLLTWTEPGWL